MVWHVSDAKPIDVLKSRFGSEIHLQGHQDEDVVYRIAAEFAVGGNQYAVLQKDVPAEDDDVDIFRITEGKNGDPELESIEDDDEWEDVFDVFDEMTFHFDDEA